MLHERLTTDAALVSSGAKLRFFCAAGGAAFLHKVGVEHMYFEGSEESYICEKQGTDMGRGRLFGKAPPQ
jgi:hypothetical protein